MNTPEHSDARGGRTRLLVTCAVAFAAALLLLLGVILPAEYSLDPLRTGQALGVLGLADGAGTQPVTAAAGPHRSERVEFTLAPFESVEYSYQMDRDQTLLFSWRASGEVVYNLHSSPATGPEGYAESFAAGRSDAHQGTYVAPFNGRHGWFFENRGATEVQLRLATAGFMRAAVRAAVGSQAESEPAGVFDD